MQIETHIHAGNPRSDCREQGVEVIGSPRASKNSGFTLRFKAFTIEVIRSARNVKDAQKIHRLNRNQMHEIMRRAMKCGFAGRPENKVASVGMVEKKLPFGEGGGFVHERRGRSGPEPRVDAERGRRGKTASALIGKAFTPWQRERVCCVAVDLSAPFCNAIRKTVPPCG